MYSVSLCAKSTVYICSVVIHLSTKGKYIELSLVGSLSAVPCSKSVRKITKSLWNDPGHNFEIQIVSKIDGTPCEAH